MKRTLLAEVVAALIVAAFSAPVFAQTTPKLTPASSPSPATAPKAAVSQNVLPVPDKGTFRILLSGAEVGTEQFETQAVPAAPVSFAARRCCAPRASRKCDRPASCVLPPTARPLGYKWTAQAEKKASGSVDFKEGAATTLLDLGNGKDPYQADFMFPSPRVAVLDNNLYYQYALVAQLYDWNAKGRQDFPVLIPQDVTPGNISVESLGPRTVEGGTFETLRINTADLEILAFYDARRRLMRVEVPAAMVTIVRR